MMIVLAATVMVSVNPDVVTVLVTVLINFTYDLI